MMFSFNRIIASLAALLVVGGAAGGCGRGGERDGKGGAGAPSRGREEVSKPRKGGSLVIGMQQEPEILNEAVNSMVAVVYTCNLVFSKFVKYNDRLELVPDLITEVPTVENGGISSDFLTYTYHLRPDARWHDGRPVTSLDVAFSYDVMVNPDINVETRQGWDIIERVETPDDRTVVFHLREVYANFAGDCFYDESVLPKHLLEEWLGASFQEAPFHRAPVGSGPFVFKEWVPGSHLRLAANRGYYGEGPYLDEIVIVFVPDANALVAKLETGEITAVDNGPNQLIALSERQPRVALYRNMALFNEHLDLNCESPILQDRNVRRALALATDRKEISERIYDGVWIPAYGDEHPSSPYYSKAADSLLAYDPAAANELLARSGWVDRDGDGIREKGGKPLRLSISTTAGNMNRERTQIVLRAQYRKAGVDLVLHNYNATYLFASYDEAGILRNGAYEIALYAALSPPDPSTKEGSYSARFVPPAGQNFTRIRNESLTELLSRGSRTVDFAGRKRIYDEVALVLAEEVPVIPLLWVTQLDAMPAVLRGYRPNPTQSGDTWNANEWWLEK